MWLVRLFPAPFRARFGDEMVEDIRVGYARAVSRGRAATLTFAWATALNLLRSLIVERVHPTWQRATKRDVTGGGSMSTWRGWTTDVRQTVRGMRSARGFTAVTVLTLALGIGASTAMFSVVYGVLLKPLPFEAPDRLVSIMHFGAIESFPVMNHGPATYFAALDHQRVFEGVGVWETNQRTITGHGEPENVDALTVTHTTLPLLRVRPALGRLFVEEDDVPGAPQRLILTHGYWQSRFGGATDVIGRAVQVNGTPAEIIGVLPASFRFLRERPMVLLPQQLDRADGFHIEFDFQVLGRLKAGVTIAEANADMASWLERLPPVFDRLQLRPYVRPLVKDAVGDAGNVLWVLLAAVGIVMLVACANVANLFLVRAESRRAEFAMRSALGASRGRLTRLMMSESVLLSLASGVVSVAFAYFAIRLLRRIAPVELPRIEEIAIAGPVLLFTICLALLSGVLFALAAVMKFGGGTAGTLHEAGRRSSDSRARHRTRNALVVAQIALSLILLILSGLMVRTFAALGDVAPGFTRAEEVQTFRIAVPTALVPDREPFTRLIQTITERLARVPGVVSVGFASAITMEGEDNGNPVYVEEFPVERPPLRRYRTIGPGYFETMGNRLVAGRSITWDDIRQQRPVVVISRTLAEAYWEDPQLAIGKRMRSSTADEWHEIVGVGGEERDDGIAQPATPLIYWPLADESYDVRSIAFAVRSSRVGSPTFMRELQQAVWSVDSNLPLAAVQTLEQIHARSMARTSFAMVMIGIAAALGMLLGAIGIYGVIAYIAAQRTHEVGIRMALGARMGDVRRMFLRHGLRLTAIGIVFGIATALALTGVMARLLYGVAPTDPVTYLAVSVVLAAVAALATYIPARRASLVDPLIAMRADTR